MLIFTDYRMINKLDMPNYLIFNMSSYIEGYNRLYIVPPVGTDCATKEFDIAYANYILTNEQVFTQVVGCIISTLLAGVDVVILVTIDDGGPYDAITESLQKFIMGRYGYESFIIYDEDDLIEACRSRVGSFTVDGVYNADNDINLLSLNYARTHNINEEGEFI